MNEKQDIIKKNQNDDTYSLIYSTGRYLLEKKKYKRNLNDIIII